MIHFWLLSFFSFVEILSLVSLPIFFNSLPIILGDISSSLLTPELDEAPIRSAKIQSASWK